MVEVSTNRSIDLKPSRYNWISEDPEFGDKRSGRGGLSMSSYSSTNLFVDHLRINPSYNNINYITYQNDDNRKSTPEYELGENRNFVFPFTFGLGSGLYKDEWFGIGSGYGFKIGLGASLPFPDLLYVAEKTKDDRKNKTLTSINVNMPFQFITPKYQLGKGITLYPQLRADLSYSHIFSNDDDEKGVNNLHLTVNTIGLFLQDVPLGRGASLDWNVIQLYSKMNLLSSDSKQFKDMYGAGDLNSGNGFFMGNYLKTMATAQWDNISFLVPYRVDVYGKTTVKDTPVKYWPYSLGMTMHMKSMNLGIEYNCESDGKEGDIDLITGINIFNAEKFKLNVSGYIKGVNQPKKTYGLGVSSDFELLGMKGHASANAVWYNVGNPPTPVKGEWYDYDTWDGMALKVEEAKLKGDSQVSHTFNLACPGVTVRPGERLYLTIASDNDNNEDGIAFRNGAGGPYLPGNANAKIASIKVYDESKPAGQQLIKGLGASLIEQNILDDDNNPPVLEIPDPPATARYIVKIDLTTQVSDMLPDPAVPESKVMIKFKRE